MAKAERSLQYSLLKKKKKDYVRVLNKFLEYLGMGANFFVTFRPRPFYFLHSVSATKWHLPAEEAILFSALCECNKMTPS